MEKNRLFIALGVVLLLAGALYLTRRPSGSENAERPSDPWRRIERAQVTKIVITRPGSEPAVELEKRDNHWFMNRPGQGPADETAVNDALEGLTEMHVASIAAREPSSHAEMEVDDAHAIHVQLFRGGAEALNLWVGKNLDGGTAVRAPGGPTVYRVDRSIRFALSKEPREWRDRAITHLERDHVRSVAWTNPRGTYHFDRNGDTWTPGAGTPPIERFDTARLNQTVTNLLDLRAMDFAAAGANTGIGPASPRVTINVDNGQPVTLKLGSSPTEGEVYVQREGSDIVYTVGRSHAGEIDLDVSSIQAPPPSDGGHDGGADATAAPPAPAAAGGDGGSPSIPPEVMEQIRRQLQQQGMRPH